MHSSIFLSSRPALSFVYFPPVTVWKPAARGSMSCSSGLSAHRRDSWVWSRCEPRAAPSAPPPLPATAWPSFNGLSEDSSWARLRAGEGPDGLAGVCSAGSTLEGGGGRPRSDASARGSCEAGAAVAAAAAPVAAVAAPAAEDGLAPATAAPPWVRVCTPAGLARLATGQSSCGSSS